MALPSLVHDYNDARIEGFAVGPRREITLDISILSWNGSTGRYGATVQVRFGAVTNLDKVAEFFESGHQHRSELAYIRYSETSPSKPGHLFIDVAFERTDARICIACGNVSVTDVPAKNLKTGQRT